MPDDTMKAGVERFIIEMAGAAQTISFYGRQHAIPKQAINKLHLKMSDLLATRPEITIGIIGSEIAFEKEPFYQTSKNISGFIDHLKKRGIEKISFLRGAEKKELEDFVTLFSPHARQSPDAVDVEKTMEMLGIKNIVIGKIGLVKEAAGKDEDPVITAKSNFNEGLGFLKDAAENLSDSQTLDVNAARFFVSKLIGNLLKNKYSLLILTSIKHRDEYTFVHSINVAIFTLVQAESLGLGQSALADIGIAALLHDTGKLALAGDIIRKKTKLSAQDMDKVQSHPIDGAKVLVLAPGIPILAAIASFEHHIKYNMEGYPKLLFGDKINPVSMMVTIADVYDALRSKRSYREDMTPEMVYDEMLRMSGSHFSPELLDNFFNVIGVYPPGTLVELSDKSIGLVVKESAIESKRPQVELLYDGKGDRVQENVIINLLEKEGGREDYKLSIVRSIAQSENIELPEKYKAG